MSDPEQPEPRVTAAPLATWLVASFFSTLCGIGGGIFAVPLLHYRVRVPFKTAIGTALVVVFSMTLVATTLEFLRADSTLDWTIVGLLICGGYPGNHIGHALGKRIDSRKLKMLFALVLTVAAVRMLATGSGVPEAQSSQVVLDATRVVLIIVIGLLGGIVAPLLGIAGGLVVIPSLFLLLPEMSYLQARSCGLAVGVFNAAQSSWLHLRGGTVNLKVAGPFSAAALVGAVFGVWAVHLPGAAEIARVVLVLVILMMVVRFSWDVWTTRPKRS